GVGRRRGREPCRPDRRPGQGSGPGGRDLRTGRRVSRRPRRGRNRGRDREPAPRRARRRRLRRGDRAVGRGRAPRGVRGRLMARPLVLVLGGTRSGKSTYGLARVRAPAGGRPVAYLAPALSAVAGAPELEDRIDRHRRSRPADWPTIEVGRDLPAAPATPGDAPGLLHGTAPLPSWGGGHR